MLLYLTIKGQGETGGKEFLKAVDALYQLAHGVKNICKKRGRDFVLGK
jgi:hypothetical protein